MSSSKSPQEMIRDFAALRRSLSGTVEIAQRDRDFKQAGESLRRWKNRAFRCSRINVSAEESNNLSGRMLCRHACSRRERKGRGTIRYRRDPGAQEFVDEMIGKAYLAIPTDNGHGAETGWPSL
jgi:hypothetical protein